ncbi:MAG: aminotransferase class I/II-fold pyridoxal phosphate-dependent enzyme [Bacteroidota bacterium]
MKQQLQFGSLCVHDPERGETTRPHQLPIYATSSFEFETIDQGIHIFEGKESGHVYGRYGNPTMEVVAEKIARLEGYGLDKEVKGILVSSGMSAISTLLLALLRPGDKILTQGNLYGGTTELFLKIFQPMGIELVLTDLTKIDSVEEQLKADKSIRLIYFETPANPTLACVDMEALCQLAKIHGQTTVADNTFCTPYLQQPMRFGVDYVIHSTTKYLNGHGNSIAGAIVGESSSMQGKVWTAMKLAGTNCNPFDAWLVNNGLKTLELRMDRHSENAMTIARFLEQHPKVGRVNYCGLPSHPDHEIASKQMQNGFGGMLSFELKGGLQAGIELMNRVRFCTLAPTLGDVDTLILHPASMSHVNVAPEIRLRNGITDGLIRLSVGIESAVDIQGDLAQAMED